MAKKPEKTTHNKRSAASQEKLKILGEMVASGLSPAQIARKLGKNVQHVSNQLGHISGVVTVAGDGKGAEHLTKLADFELAKRILGSRWRFDEALGVYLVDGHITPVGDFFRLAGLSKP